MPICAVLAENLCSDVNLRTCLVSHARHLDAQDHCSNQFDHLAFRNSLYMFGLGPILQLKQWIPRVIRRDLFALRVLKQSYDQFFTDRINSSTRV